MRLIENEVVISKEIALCCLETDMKGTDVFNKQITLSFNIVVRLRYL